MKRFVMMLLVLGLVASCVTTAEAARKTKKPTRVERTVEGSYGPYPAPVTGCNEPLGKFYCLAVETHSDESFFTAKVTDAHGQPVFVWVGGAGRGNSPATFCGETTEPIWFSPGAELQFYVADLAPSLVDPPLDCPTNRIKTTGTISVTLSNLP
jgi:hypothetical protein